jgi:hypothetical protein
MEIRGVALEAGNIIGNNKSQNNIGGKCSGFKVLGSGSRFWIFIATQLLNKSRSNKRDTHKRSATVTFRNKRFESSCSYKSYYNTLKTDKVHSIRDYD